MGFWGLLLLMLAGGYVLGIWAAATVFRESQPAYEAGTLEELASPGLSQTRRQNP